MKKLVVLMSMLVMFTMVGFVGQAMALIPTIDGVASMGEWVLADMHTFATDPNEAGIPDEYDIHHLWVRQVDEGGSDDGLYFRVDLFGTPTLVGGLDSEPGDEVFLRISIDFDGNGVSDLFVNFNGGQDPGDGLLGINTSGSGTGGFLGYGSGTVGEFPGGIYEFFVPSSFFDVFVDISPATGFRIRLDNNGSPPDDFLPNTGFTTGIPEPASVIMIGTGLLGLMGFRRKFSA